MTPFRTCCKSTEVFCEILYADAALAARTLLFSYFSNFPKDQRVYNLFGWMIAVNDSTNQTLIVYTKHHVVTQLLSHICNSAAQDKRTDFKDGLKTEDVCCETYW